ncbi:MAG: hypothetical protein WBS54_00180 [Acidobacteriota bacterium]
MKRASIVVLLCGLILLAGCAAKKPVQSQLQIREFQTRTFSDTDMKLAMKAMMNVLQDDGFIIKQGSLELGLLSAEKQVDVESHGEAFWAVFFAGSQARYKKNSVFECSVNVSDFGSAARVRANFQMRLINNKGELMEVQRVEDAAYYQDFFSKVDKALFLAKEKL